MVTINANTTTRDKDYLNQVLLSIVKTNNRLLSPSPSPSVQSAKYPAGYIYANLRTACGNRLSLIYRIIAVKSQESNEGGSD